MMSTLTDKGKKLESHHEAQASKGPQEAGSLEKLLAHESSDSWNPKKRKDPE